MPLTILQLIGKVLEEHLGKWLDVYELSVLCNKSEGSIRKVLSRESHNFLKKKEGRKTLYCLEDIEWRPSNLFPEDFMF